MIRHIVSRLYCIEDIKAKILSLTLGENVSVY
jgi:hypothetical protein